MVKIFVGRIPAAITKDRLRDLFSQYGKVTECEIVKDYGFVHMDSEEAAESAIKSLHNCNIEGGNLTVEKSHGRPSKSKSDQGSTGRSDRGAPMRGGPGRRDNDRRGGDFGGGKGADFRERERSPVYRRRNSGGDYNSGYGGGNYSRNDYGRGGGDRYDRESYNSSSRVSSDRGYGGYGDRGYNGSSFPLPSATPYYDSSSRAPVPAPYNSNGGGGSNYGSSYDRPAIVPTAPPSRYGASSGPYGGSNYGPPSSSYGNAPPATSYDNYDRYGSYGRGSSSGSGRYGHGSGSGVPAAGVTRRY